MGDDMKRLRDEAVDSYVNHKKEVVYEVRTLLVDIENKRLKKENKHLVEENRRHITEKNQLGSKNDLLKKENAELIYRLSSYEEGKKVIRNKIVNVIKKQA